MARERGVRSVVHTHALSAVLAADLAAGNDHVVIRDLEMLKGIRGLTNQDVAPAAGHRQHRPRAGARGGRGAAPSRIPASHAAWGVLVRDHGCYIWGADVWEAKRHTEVYHYLFDAVVARHDRGHPSAMQPTQP